MTENPLDLFNQTTSGEAAFQTLYVYDKLIYDFNDDDLTIKSIIINENATFKEGINVTSKTILNDDTDLSGNLNVTGNTNVSGISTFNNIEITGTLKDGDGETGTAGQVLSTDGSDLAWINTSSANVGSASKVGVNLDSDSATTMYMTFVDATSGNEEIRVDKSLTYKPSTGSFLGIATFTGVHITSGLRDTTGDVGTSGQVLSATGTTDGGTNWINVGEITAGTASSIAVNTNSANKDQYIPFLNETSGSQQVRADAGLKYNPHSDTLKPGRIEFDDDNELRFGDSNDLIISHTDSLSSQDDSNGDSVLAGTTWASYINERGAGPLVFKTDGGPSTGAFQFYDTGWRPILKLFSGSSARAALYHAGAEKLVTSSTGVTVTGTVAATSFSGSLAASNLTGALPAISGANLTGIVGVPTGCILLWSGAANAIPTGFVLCDGNNSTPNLSGKFVVGYSASDGDYDVNDTGGSASVTLTVNQIPAHTHTHTKATHPAGSGPEQNQSGNVEDRTNFGDTGTTSSTGGGQSHENRPPYYALCYIMKT